jgi:hypothetical protein
VAGEQIYLGRDGSGEEDFKHLTAIFNRVAELGFNRWYTMG